jgi:hypothetical protein
MKLRICAPRAGLALALVAIGLDVCKSASAQSFVPARIRALEGQPQCPSNVRESPILTCRVVIDETGAVHDEPSTHCFGKLGGDDRRRADTVRSNLLRSRFEPARIDGVGVEVSASLRVSFVEINGRCDVTVYLNLADQQGAAAADYFAPQEIMTDGGWRGALQARLRPRYPGRSYDGMAFVMSVAVDELGNASDGRIEANNFVLEESVQAAVGALEKQQFIPATIDGVARPARYFDFIYVLEPPRRRLR